MKKKIFFILLLLIISLTNVKAVGNESILTFKKEVNINNTLAKDNIVSFKDNYVLTDNLSTLYNYDYNNKIIATKELPSTTNLKTIKYNENILVAGAINNKLKLYIVDPTLKILNQVDTNILLKEYEDINLYNYNDKVYLMLTEDNNLSNNNIYEIDSNLVIKENKLSNYNNIKDILKSDYYLIHHNDTTKDNNTYHYHKSLRYNDTNILLGNIIDVNGNIIKPVISVYSDDNKLINTIELNYQEAIDMEVVKDKIIVLVYDLDSILVTLDSNLKEINTELIEVDTGVPTNLFKILNNLVYEEQDVGNKENLYLYSYDLNINVTENPLGTVEIKTNPIPFEEIKFITKPNSGYEIENIVIKDIEGNVINPKDNKFIMPNNDLTFTVNYKETITNPETADRIVYISILLVLASYLTYKLYLQLRWLK